MSIEPRIFHIANDKDVAELELNNQYRCASLDKEGFIHCCDRQQLSGVVERYYQGVDRLKLLVIDPDKLEPRVVLENTVGGSELFPHVYGSISAHAIDEVLDFGLNSSQRMNLKS